MLKIYIETSVASYFVAEQSGNIRIAAHQLATHNMWDQLHKYDIYISDIVVEEASKGNPELAEKRLYAIKDFQVLAINDNASALAEQLLLKKAILQKFPEDAIF